MTEEKCCEACGVYYTPTNPAQKYCPACGKNGKKIQEKIEKRMKHLAAKDWYYNPKVFTKTCRECEKTYCTPHAYSAFCSDSCRIKHNKRDLRCTNCGKRLIDVLSEIPDKELASRYHYCSDACRKAYLQNSVLERYGTKTCEQCKKTFVSPNKRFCSTECFHAYQKAHHAASQKDISPKK